MLVLGPLGPFTGLTDGDAHEMPAGCQGEVARNLIVALHVLGPGSVHTSMAHSLEKAVQCLHRIHGVAAFRLMGISGCIRIVAGAIRIWDM